MNGDSMTPLKKLVHQIAVSNEPSFEEQTNSSVDDNTSVIARIIEKNVTNAEALKDENFSASDSAWNISKIESIEPVTTDVLQNSKSFNSADSTENTITENQTSVEQNSNAYDSTTQLADELTSSISNTADSDKEKPQDHLMNVASEPALLSQNTTIISSSDTSNSTTKHVDSINESKQDNILSSEESYSLTSDNTEAMTMSTIKEDESSDSEMTTDVNDTSPTKSLDNLPLLAEFLACKILAAAMFPDAIEHIESLEMTDIISLVPTLTEENNDSSENTFVTSKSNEDSITSSTLMVVDNDKTDAALDNSRDTNQQSSSSLTKSNDNNIDHISSEQSMPIEEVIPSSKSKMNTTTSTDWIKSNSIDINEDEKQLPLTTIHDISNGK